MIGAERLRELAVELAGLLKLRSLPIGMKLFAEREALLAVPGIRLSQDGKRFTTCQLVTNARLGGQTIGIVAETVLPFTGCASVIGLKEPDPRLASGETMTGVWFENREAAHAHQQQMPRVAPGEWQGLAASPLRQARLDPPDIVLFYANPAQMILFINGLQWRTYRRIGFSVTGETACADSWGRALASGEISLSIPCYAERRYGGVADDELALALPPDEFEIGITGLKGLEKAGLRYPILPYSTSNDPGAGLAKSYGLG
ncbi:MAG TPA: DUF169 domain-containing protein [Acetobacteraceae bacterium]|jgi:uncharacterized protein (DUF169 family)|nr:DUF169 domain-containing protein [Acetobacteraceae bacterium]